MWARVPDFVIGTTVLIVAIGMPFYFFRQAEHAQPASATAVLRSSTAAQGAGSSLAESNAGGFLGHLFAMPVTGSTVTPMKSPGQRRSSKRVRAAVSPTTSSTPATSATPVASPPGGPVVVVSTKSAVGPAPLTVTVDASASTDQTPIVNVLIDCGSGTGASEVSKPWIASCQYDVPGVYVITVSAYDIDTKSAQTTAVATVRAPSGSPSP